MRKTKLSNFNPIFREYASSAAFRLELSAGMIEFLLWLQEHPQTEDIVNTSDMRADSWTRHPNHTYALRPLMRRGLVVHEWINHPKGIFTTGPMKTEGRGYYRIALTRAGKLAAFMVREAGWGDIAFTEEVAHASS